MWIACLSLLGCPSSPPEPSHPPADAAPTAAADPDAPTAVTATAAASSAPTVEGTWRVVVTSAAPGLNPAMFDTPEKRARVLFDHEAKAAGGRIEVTQRTLKRRSPIKDDDAAAELDRLVRTVDWAALEKRVAAEEPSEGATEFRFEVSLGDETTAFRTTDLESHPDLVTIVETLRTVVGVP